MDNHYDSVALATAMWQSDRAAQELGMTLDHAGRGEATLSMLVTPVMANGLGICHGGYIFMLADCALAAASNSYPVTAVGQQYTVTYINPGRLGARLSAEAREVHRQRRNGIYDVHIRDSAGQAIAEFRGHVRLVKTLRTGATDA